MQRFDKYPFQTLGFALVLIGTLLLLLILLIVARSMKPKQKTDAIFTQAPANE